MKNQLLEARHRTMSAEIIKSHNSEQVLSKQLNCLLKREFTTLDYVERLTGGRCNSVYKISYDGDDKVLKISTGLYRITELKRETKVMKHLINEGCEHIVPRINRFEILEDCAYIIEEYVEGGTVREKLRNCECIEDRLEIWKRLGQVLSEIHKFYQDEDIKCTWLSGQLEMARINMKSNLLDLEEFEEETAIEMLEWLNLNKPKRKGVSLLHGDYRTKNIIVDNNMNYKVIDWGFVDIGDPYYDLAIIDYYFKDNLDRDSFYSGYRDNQYDRELIEYYTKLSKFINI